MKRTVVLLILVFQLFSCAKEDEVTDPGTPVWLQDIISQNEEELKTDPESLLGITAWIRYTYLEEYYFEYHNPILSSFPPVYDWEGNQVQYGQDTYQAYSQGKCCKWYVWKGPSYFLDD